MPENRLAIFAGPSRVATWAIVAPDRYQAHANLPRLTNGNDHDLPACAEAQL
jgi:hypothetical protein